MGQFGTYQWFIEHGAEKIHPDDLERFKSEAHNCKIFEFVEDHAEYITIQYGNNQYRVVKDLFKPVPVPKYRIGQRVKAKSTNEDAVVSDVMWHHDMKSHYYFLIVNGKKKSTRYFAADIMAMPIG